MASGWDTPPTADESKKAKSGWDAPPTADELASSSPAPQTSIGEAVTAHGLSGMTFGHADEGVGGVAALLDPARNKFHEVYRYLAEKMSGKPTITPEQEAAVVPTAPAPEKDFGQRYVDYRNIVRDRLAQTEKDHPTASMASEIGGGVLTSSALAAAGLGGLPLATAEGAAAGSGYSNADLTKGELGRYAFDTGLGAVTGAGAHGLATVAGKGLGWAAGKFGGKAAELEAGMAESAARKAAKETSSGAQKASTSSAGLNRALEKIEEWKHTDPVVYQQLLNEGLLPKLQREGLQKTAEELPAMFGEREAARSAARDLAATEGDRAAQALQEQMSVGGAFAPLKRAGLRYGGRAAAGAALGAIGGGFTGHGTEGAAVGALGLNLALAPTMVRAATNPAVRRLLYSGASSLLGGTSEAIGSSLAADAPGATRPIVEGVRDVASSFVDAHMPGIASMLGGDKDSKAAAAKDRYAKNFGGTQNVIPLNQEGQ